MAKRLFVLNNLFLALVLLNGDTSFWEGASSPDVYGSLPDRGFYVSTSFFPRNTVVDITSLETGTAIQVIVADNSSSPGNGVILSRDAAEALGMGRRSSMRIRMSPPSDTAAFSRFSDGRSFSGDPDYDPKAFIRANTLPVETQALSASPYGTGQGSAYAPPAGSPPPVSIIPDQAQSGTAVTDSRFDLPNTVFPLAAPSEPVTIFMPAPVPTAVTVDDPAGSAVAGMADAPSAARPSAAASETEASKTDSPAPSAEVPEVYEPPRAPGAGYQTGRPPYSEPAAPVLANEPEDPFPDVVVPSGNPIDYQNMPNLALAEAAIDESAITGAADMTSGPGTETVPEQIAQYDGIPEISVAEYAPGKAEVIDLYDVPFREDIPDATDTVALADGGWIIPGGESGLETVPAGADGMPAETGLPETEYTEYAPDEAEAGDLYDALFREDIPEASFAYAEPDATDTVALADGGWMIPGGESGLETVPAGADGMPAETGLPETEHTEYAPDEAEAGDLYDALFREDIPEASLAYAEPDATDTVALADGPVILRDREEADELYLLPPFEEAAAPLHEPDFMEQQGDLYEALALLAAGDGAAETSLAYAEPYSPDAVGLADGSLLLEDKTLAETMPAGAEPYSPDAVGLADGSLLLEDKTVAETMPAGAEPYSPDAVGLADGSLLLEDKTVADILRLLSFPQETVGRLREPDFRTDADVSLPYAEPHDKYDLPEAVPPEYQATLQDLYDTIARLESDAEAPQEVIVDLGPAGEEYAAMLPLPEGSKAAESGGRKAYLVLIKNLSSGKYYLQIGVFTQKEALVRRLASLNWAYPYALETGGTVLSPKYKLLVGPVNEGESNALLLRFKREGFSGAFIRREG